jgi:signal transduction histidine kinase
MPESEDTSFARLVSLACHDLRTPLATVHGFVRTLTRLQNFDEPVARYLGMMEAASTQMAELLDELGLAARIETGRYEPVRRPVDVRELARAAAERVGNGAVTVSGSGGMIETEPEAAGRAVANLARCAVRHGGLERVGLEAEGVQLSLAPVTSHVAPIILGRELRDLGAAVAGRVIEALDGSLELEGETLRVRLPESSS